MRVCLLEIPCPTPSKLLSPADEVNGAVHSSDQEVIGMLSSRDAMNSLQNLFATRHKQYTATVVWC